MTYGTVSRLGVYMKIVAEKLRADGPMTAEYAQKLLRARGCFYGEFGGHQTLERLEARGIAFRVRTETGDIWTRGEHWNRAAARYGWKA